MFSLAGKLALVTGGSRGIGRAIAQSLGQQGAQIAATATTLDGAKKISQSFQEAGIDGYGFVFDVNDSEQQSQLLLDIAERFNKAPGILVNNAGITRDNIVLRMKQNQWDEVIETNLNAVFRLCKACLKPMVKARHGRIINITSVSGLMGNFGQANYAAAKAGITALSKSLAREMASFGITVNCVAPGFTQTDMVAAMKPEQKASIESMVPMKRLAEPAEIAAAVLYLASDEAAYVTGETCNVNGGLYTP